VTVDTAAAGAADLEALLGALRAGAVVAVATDTVYGLVCDPGNPAAVQRVYELKRRPRQLELTLLAGAAAQLDGIVRWNRAALRLAAEFWPGPLSLVLPVGDRRLAVPRQGETLSVRVPGHPALLALLTRSGPLGSTSANRHGEPEATTAAAVRELFGDGVALVLEGGSPGGVASTIIDCSVTPPRVLREGPIDQSRLVDFVQG
jgi:L-threonylcarbamoyladenylate synthase